MARGALRGALVALTLAGLLTAAGTPTALARSDRRQAAHPQLHGVNIDTTQLSASALAWVRRMHGTVVRLEVRWSQLEPQEGVIEPEALAALDHFMGEVAADHLKAVMMIEGTPCWASSAPEAIAAACVPGTFSKANAWPPKNDQSYARFVAFLAKRYAPELAAIEIWNEPDQANEDYWAGPEKARHYAELLRAAYPAIKAAAPGVQVIAGSFIGPNGTFLRLLYENHIEGYYNGLAVHFYTLTLAALYNIHQVQLQYHDHAPLWLDEFGWASCWPQQRIEEEQGCVTPKVQAENLANITHELARLPWVRAEIFYKLQDSPGQQFGVLDEAGRPKPSFRAVARSFADPLARPQPIRLRLRRRGGQVVASGSAPVGDYLQLEALRGGRVRYQATFTLNRFNRFRLTLPRALGRAHLLVRVHLYALHIIGSAQARI